MFTQKLSMDCSQEQYEKYLKEELEKMGYGLQGYLLADAILVNNSNRENGQLIMLSYNSKNYHSRTYLGKFNAPLFLARAAMTDSKFGGVGEWWRYEGENNCWFTYSKLYKAQGSLDNKGAFITDIGNLAGRHPSNLNYFRKATIDEITNHFTNKVMEEKTFTTTRSQMGKIHGIACSTWKPKIVEYTRQYGNTFDDAVTLPQSIVEEMFAAATTEQVPVLKSVFPEFKKDKNAFVKEFESTKTRELSAELFGNPYAFQISTEAARDANRMDLYGRGFYINSDYNVTLIPIESSTVIEITKK